MYQFEGLVHTPMVVSIPAYSRRSFDVLSLEADAFLLISVNALRQPFATKQLEAALGVMITAR